MKTEHIKPLPALSFLVDSGVIKCLRCGRESSVQKKKFKGKSGKQYCPTEREETIHHVKQEATNAGTFLKRRHD